MSGARAVVGVAALYALLLQAFLAGAIPIVSPETGIICAEHASGLPGPEKPARHDHGCCTLVQAGSIAPPSGTAVALEPSRRSVAVIWPFVPFAVGTGPPTHSESARGPPVA